MNFRFLIVVLAFVGTFFIATTDSQAGGMSNKDTASYQWNFASLAPKGIAWAVQVEKIVYPEIIKACDGDLYVKVFWGGSMGDEEDVVQKIQSGRLQGGGFGGQGAVFLCPEFSVFELPFLFNDYGEVDYIKEKMSLSMDGYFRKQNFKLFLWNDQDFDQIYSTEYRLDTIDDFKKAEFITWYGVLEDKLFERMESNVVPVNVPDAARAMKQGRTDSGIAPAAWIVGAQLYSVFKLVNPINIRYSPSPVVASTKAWDTLPESYKTNLMFRQKDVERRFNEAIRKDNLKCYNAMLQYGIWEVKTSPENLKQIRQKAIRVWDDLAGVMYPKELLDEVLAHLEQYRAIRKN